MPDNEQFETYKALLDSTRLEILHAIPKGDSAAWKAITLLLPVALASGLSLLAFMVQTNIQTSISNQMALTQDYVKERLQTYKEVHERVVALKTTASEAGTKTALEAKLADPTHALIDSYSRKSIFISDLLLEDLDSLWSKGVDANGLDTIDAATVAAIKKAANDVETQMRRDLLVQQLDTAQKQPGP